MTPWRQKTLNSEVPFDTWGGTKNKESVSALRALDLTRADGTVRQLQPARGVREPAGPGEPAPAPRLARGAGPGR